MKIAVLLADDHEVVRRGLKELLTEEFPEMEIEMAKGIQELKGQLARRHFQLVVLDLGMPGANGLQTIESIKQASPQTRVLVFSMHSEEQIGVRAIRAGADGFLNKDVPGEQLTEAIRRLLAGKRYFSQSLAGKLADLVLQPRTHGLESLSNREVHVLRSIGRGLSTGDIAAELQLSVKTVSTYRSRILEKLGLRTTADLVRFALENQLGD